MQSKLFPFLILLVPLNFIVAQENLIPNPDFEEYYSCDYDVLSTMLSEQIPSWSHREASPRYFNTICAMDSISSYFNLPLHSAQSGNGYISQILLTPHHPENSPWNLRQYSQVQLKEDLKANRQYFLSYYVAPTFDDDGHFSDYGVHFSNNLIVEDDLGYYPYSPVLLDPQLEVDTLIIGEPGEWKRVTHCFTPTEDYRVMTVGIFENINEITSGLPANTGGQEFVSYDNFFLAEIEPDLTLAISESDTICIGDCVTLSTNHSLIEGEFLWDLPGSDLGTSTEPEVVVCYDQAGVYDVRIEVSHCALAYENLFSKAITVLPEIVQPMWKDTIICQGETVVFDVSNLSTAITWWDANNNKVRPFSNAGTYTYTLSNGFCEEEFMISIAFIGEVAKQVIDAQVCLADSFYFQGVSYTIPGVYYDTLKNELGCDSIVFEIAFSFFEEIPLEISGNLDFCVGDEVAISIASAHTNLYWSDGSEGNFLENVEPGDYSVSGDDENGCHYEEKFTLTLHSKPEVFAENLIEVIYSPNMELPVSYQGEISNYVWSDASYLNCEDCPFPQLIYPEEGLYFIKVNNQYGCEDTASIHITFESTNVYVPNTIGLQATAAVNQILFAQSNHEIPYSMSVYDRWGGVLYANDNLLTNDRTQGWVPKVGPGVYVYVINFLDNHGQAIMLAGDVTVW